jgi:glycerol-3-phosphate dehydrogenase
MDLRAQLLQRLGAQPVDVLVIGGGIVGAAIARDAAMRGLRVSLIEQGDFAGGTSSKTSKLIHGGLRYLESGQVRLVLESLRERRILRTIAPPFVRPIPLLLPIYRGDQRSRGIIQFGLWLYDLLGLSSTMRRHRILSVDEVQRLEPQLSTDGLQAAASFLDCQMDDARLCLATILQAIRFGATCCNYVRAVSLPKVSGRIHGAVLQDVLSGQTMEVRAGMVVNATGPWGDGLRRLSDRRAGGRLAPTKGIHLVVPRVLDQPLYVQTRSQGRMVFLLPWNGYTLVGTTESPVEDLDHLAATSDEAVYLLSQANRVLRDRQLAPSDILSSFAGARPLLAYEGSATRASREHHIEIDRFGLISVMGGKYTTHRVMAKQAVDLIVAMTRRRVDRCLTDQVSLLESTHPIVLDRWQDVTRHMPPVLVGRLMARYGTGIFRMLQLIAFEPQLAQPVCQHHETILAELVYGVQDELACTVSDLLLRRTSIGYSQCHGLDGLPAMRDVLHRYGRIPQEQLEAQVEQYLTWVAQATACRQLDVAEPLPLAA